MLKMFCPICPKRRPWAAIINENSEIWAREIPVKKLVLFLYANAFTIRVMSRGLRRIAANIIIVRGIKMLLAKVNCSPRETKKIIAKKSLRGRIFPSISMLYGRVARLTPAVNAPIITEKSKMYASKANRKQ